MIRYTHFKRKMKLLTPVVKIGDIKIGGKNPIVIQSMTNTDTGNVTATVAQCIELANEGAELIRMTVDNENSARAVPKIRELLKKKGYGHLPLIGDFHFNGHELLEKFPDCAKTLDKYRINPSNVGKDKNFEKIISIAIKYKKPIRIGVNFGSINFKNEKTVINEMIKTAIDSAKLAEKLGLKRDSIVLSVKMSDVNDIIKVYQELAKKMQKEKRIYALHIGLTEAGSGTQGTVSSISALAVLLHEGIGDTIRISITPQGGESRTKEVQLCKELLQTMGLRFFKPKVISCPGCGRTNNELLQKIVKQVNDFLEKHKFQIKNKEFKIAIMGCIVNGPGESRSSDIGLHLPGKNEKDMASVYIKGKFYKTLKGKSLIKEFLQILSYELKMLEQLKK